MLFVVYNWILSGSNSVREGLHHNQYVEDYDTLEDAQAAYPHAVVTHSKYHVDDMPMNAPSGFDPAYAGERWDDDY